MNMVMINFIDIEDFCDYVAECKWEDYSEWEHMDYTTYDIDEIHDIGLQYPISDKMLIEDLGEFEYFAMYDNFLNQYEKILIKTINEKAEELYDANYDYRADDERTYRQLVFGGFRG